MPNLICLRALISGRVQGVGYRYHTVLKAQALDLVGWVRNLEDGRVEVMVEGKRDSVDAMMQWCGQGPPAAHVEGIEIEEQPAQHFEQFEIRR
ncbi:acylphosphatase [Acaryochloris sp. IP29b_bin.137]|uniref:acylphosphatase n=1 Tax=Acaryochloris sp. IP29b_bin.137 TaxID=2969217 RepID=UPI0026137EA5|nr:acylphosphatase [Acaryochloris sp. IP29b_bin.137]